MARKIRRQESSSDDDNEGPGDGDDSTTDNSSTTSSSDDDNGSPTPASPSFNLSPTPSPGDASTTRESPAPTSINSSDILSTTGGQTVYITTTNGQTETITAKAQSTSALPASGASSSGGLSTGATAGIAVGIVVPIIIAAAILFFVYRKRRKTSQRKDGRSWNGHVSGMSDSGNKNAAVASSVPASGEQTWQSFGYGGTAELHNEDKAVETGGRPVYEMSGSIPENREKAERPGSPVGDPPEYTPQGKPSTSNGPEEDAGPAHDVVSPLSDSATYAPGEVVISPVDAKAGRP